MPRSSPLLKTELIQTDGSTYSKIADVSIEGIYAWFLLQRQGNKHINNLDILKQCICANLQLCKLVNEVGCRKVQAIVQSTL